MSRADDIFIENVKDILQNGTSTEGEKVRPHWPDGEQAYTIKKFGLINRYDLSKEFPAITLRRTAIKSCTNEMLWIWQKKSNDIHNLKSSIWDEWADEDGTIGKAYGYQMSVKHHFKDVNEEGLKHAFGDKYKEHAIFDEDRQMWTMDQIDKVIYDLKNQPFSRRILTSMYAFNDLAEMNLYPCAYSMTFNVTADKETGKLRLNAILNQRSQDMLTANNWNVAQYSVLVHMLAQVCDMEVGELVHVIGDAHIYDRHIPIIKEMIERPTHPAPKFWINPEIKDFYDFTEDDIKLIDYETEPQIKDIPVAI